MKVIVIIPARKGSKSLPKKNILLLKGRPLVSHSIHYALKSDMVSSTVVSTDCNEIAEIAKKSGALVPFLRPEIFSQDNTQDYPVMRHALDFFEAHGKIFDLYVLLRPTSPFRPPNLIEKAIDILENNSSITSIRSVTKIAEHPYRAWKKNRDGSISGFVENISESYNIPRQELPTLYFQTGDIEVIRRNTIINGSVSGDYVFPLEIEHNKMIDIDNKSDFIKAENLNVK